MNAKLFEANKNDLQWNYPQGVFDCVYFIEKLFGLIKLWKHKYILMVMHLRVKILLDEIFFCVLVSFKMAPKAQDFKNLTTPQVKMSWTKRIKELLHRITQNNSPFVVMQTVQWTDRQTIKTRIFLTQLLMYSQTLTILWLYFCSS